MHPISLFWRLASMNLASFLCICSQLEIIIAWWFYIHLRRFMISVFCMPLPVNTTVLLLLHQQYGHQCYFWNVNIWFWLYEFHWDECIWPKSLLLYRFHYVVTNLFFLSLVIFSIFSSKQCSIRLCNCLNISLQATWDFDLSFRYVGQLNILA